ncbi:hypothetical protein [Peptoniphilus indolicus]|uniref:Brp/Blh family beta-carotene 15,15'-monooxygenase n=2 Tax=Peptoniphilus indolicus TaxID=33030 RepID=G4D4W0_9FIRM|nr:hypothetical protein [Peptoniphilus indolicus]EGY79436.1 hypothetical protein HMPREF9129_1440 [Peptoniphilus indolicus ATCC 29427]SUB74610.1 Uncharacterized membrane protein [Peptoniphilus indolicus]
MEKSMKASSKSIFTAISVGMVLFSAHAGGGFATGNQANTFFISLGWPGIISAILAIFLLTATMREAMIMFNQRGISSYKELFKTLLHPFDKLSVFFEIFFYIMVVMAIAAAISGAASALQEYFAINYQFYVVVVGMLVLSLTIFGANLVRKASTFMGMAILITAVSIYTLGSFQGENFVTVLTKDFGSCGFKNLPKAILNSFVYAGFQCVTLPTMIVCGKVLEDRSQVGKAMKFSFAVNSIALVLSIVMLNSWKSFYTTVEGGTTLPTLMVTNAIGWKWLFAIYGVCLVLCLISTGVTTTFGFVSRFENSKLLNKIASQTKKRVIVAAFIITVSMAISMVGLTNIIKYGYGYCGYLAIAVVVIPFLTVGVYKNRTYGKVPSSVLGTVE